MFEEAKKGGRICAEIDLDAIEFNIQSMLRNLRPGVRLCPAIKADGYGHGAVRIARRLETIPETWGFCLATAQEAFSLRKEGIRKPLLILGYTFPQDYEALAQNGIRPTVFRPDMLEELAAVSEKTGHTIPVHIAVDTGMSRIGIPADDQGLAFVQRALNSPGLDVEGIFTHFARADETESLTTSRQFRTFLAFCDLAERKSGRKIPIRHCCNSAGIISYPGAALEMVRPGIIVYGLWPSKEVPRDIVELRPAMSIHSQIVMVKSIPAGTPVSYGGTWTAPRPTQLATIPVGYGDGFARTLSNRGCVLIRGQRAPIRGRVCMDQFMVDVTDIPDVSEGDRVTLLGRDKEEQITMEELGELSGRFNYEFACCITPRVPRIYLEGGNIT